MNSPFSVKEYVVDSQYIREYPRSTSTQDAPLKLAVKKYTPTNNPSPKPGDVTIIGAQGTGFPKVGAISLGINIHQLTSLYFRNSMNHYGKNFSQGASKTVSVSVRFG